MKCHDDGLTFGHSGHLFMREYHIISICISSMGLCDMATYCGQGLKLSLRPNVLSIYIALQLWLL